jgi:uncharacterized integral membrane protein (TIGR02327 family)
MIQAFGIDAILRILCHFIFIYLSWWALQAFRIDTLFKKGNEHNNQIRFIYLFLAITIGYTTSSFFLEFLALFRNLVAVPLG